MGSFYVSEVVNEMWVKYVLQSVISQTITGKKQTDCAVYSYQRASLHFTFNEFPTNVYTTA